jgi:predicted AlkP superfamily pyrophosphatase or phosphodiesterase
MNRLAVLNVVGLTDALIGEHTPRIAAFKANGASAHINPAFPAVTCTAQSNYLTGATPSHHGIVGNGWYNRDLAEVQFWKQSNHLVTAPKIWDALRARVPNFTCAQLFWWYNMYSSADYSITPRPMYPADGRKVFDIYTWPFSVRSEIKRDLGEFPFFGFWGPAAGVNSPQGRSDVTSRWIAESSKWIETKYQPTLSFVYLPHLDYNLQRHGPQIHSPRSALRAQSEHSDASSRELNPAVHRDLREIDAIVGDLLDFFAKRGVEVILLSEYGITNVSQPLHLNRLFRQKGWLAVKDELGLEILDPGASKIFAVADHQVAHVYLKDQSLKSSVRNVLEKQVEVDLTILDTTEKTAWGVDHSRAGDLIAVAPEDAWFTYYYWLEEAKAPDFARTVDIHRKPGYDPVELFTDPKLSPLALKAKVGWRLLQKKLGFRMLMDLIPLDASLVKGSHGRRPEQERDWPVFLTSRRELLQAPQMESTDVYHALLRHALH